MGEIEIQVPRDRAGSFDPQIVRKHQRRLTRVDEIVLSLYAKGLTTGEIAAHFDELYEAKISPDTISRITDKIIADMADWVSRPLESIYAAIFIDALSVKVRDGQVRQSISFLRDYSDTPSPPTGTADAGPVSHPRRLGAGHRPRARSDRSVRHLTGAARQWISMPVPYPRPGAHRRPGLPLLASRRTKPATTRRSNRYEMRGFGTCVATPMTLSSNQYRHATRYPRRSDVMFTAKNRRLMTVALMNDAIVACPQLCDLRLKHQEKTPQHKLLQQAMPNNDSTDRKRRSVVSTRRCTSGRRSSHRREHLITPRPRSLSATSIRHRDVSSTVELDQPRGRPATFRGIQWMIVVIHPSNTLSNSSVSTSLSLTCSMNRRSR